MGKAYQHIIDDRSVSLYDLPIVLLDRIVEYHTHTEESIENAKEECTPETQEEDHRLEK